MMTTCPFRRGESCAVVGTPMLPTPAISPASFLSCGLPANSMAPTTFIAALSWTRRTTVLPIRPAAPQTMTPNISIHRQAEIGHRLPELFQIALAHRRQRQAQLAGAFAHERKRGFDRDRIGFDEDGAEQRPRV